MDNVTHTLFALTLARTRLGRAGRSATAALVLASNAPDIDIVATIGGSANYLAWHRGPTHGPLGIVGLGLVTAGLVWVGNRARSSRGVSDGGISLKADSTAAARVDSTFLDQPDPTYMELSAVSMLGVLFHILMDLPTSYGTRLLSPFSWRWYAMDLLPIVDIYLLIALAAGLMIGRGSAEAARKWAVVVFVLMAANYAGRGLTHHQALRTADEQSGRSFDLAGTGCRQPAVASLVEVWPRIAAQGGAEPCPPTAAALPAFLSPFQWRIVRPLRGAYRVYDVDILRSQAPSGESPDGQEAMFTNVWSRAAFEAATTRSGQIFLGFSRFPDVTESADAGGVTSVRFTDMRFAAIDATRDVRRPLPFALTITMDAEHRILKERLGE